MSVAEENAQLLRLMQAMAGSITPNFRRVTMEIVQGGAVRIRVLLERDDLADRQEVEEIAFEFEALQETDVDSRFDVLVDRRPLHEIELPGRVAYGRRED